MSKWLISDQSEVEVAFDQDPSVRFTLRPLSWFDLEEARKRRTREEMRMLNNADTVAKASSEVGAQAEIEQRELREEWRQMTARDFDTGSYHVFEVLKRGVKACSLFRRISDDNLRNLHPELARWAFNEILSMTLPDADEGNASGPNSDSTTRGAADSPTRP